MSLKTIHTELNGQWLRIEGFSEGLKKLLHDFKGNHLFGYVYIDHTAGLTLDIIKLFDLTEEKISFQPSPPEKNTRIVARLMDFIESEEIRIITQEGAENYGLELPEYLHIYDRSDLNTFRAENSFHPFRAEGYPDDVQVLLPPINNNKPEIIWCRAEQYTNGVIKGTLLNDPHQNFGLSQGQEIKAVIQPFDGQDFITAQLEAPGNTPTKEKAKKKWWKFR